MKLSEIAGKQPKFKKGDCVVFVHDPEAWGDVVSVDWDPKKYDEPVYSVNLGATHEMAEESELKAKKRPPEPKGTLARDAKPEVHKRNEDFFKKYL